MQHIVIVPVTIKIVILFLPVISMRIVILASTVWIVEVVWMGSMHTNVSYVIRL
jgi:hypothetical protein